MLERLLFTGFSSNAIVAWLSIMIVIGSSMRTSWSNSWYTWNRSLAPSLTAMTSASVDDLATVSCLLLALATLFPLRYRTQPDIDFPSSSEFLVERRPSNLREPVGVPSSSLLRHPRACAFELGNVLRVFLACVSCCNRVGHHFDDRRCVQVSTSA